MRSNTLPCCPAALLPPAAQFVLLAGAGTLAKSMAKGMGRPCFRVIQTHFSGGQAVATRHRPWGPDEYMVGRTLLAVCTWLRGGEPGARVNSNLRPQRALLALC